MNAIATAPARQQRKPRAKPERRIRLFAAPIATMRGVVRITVGTEAKHYFLAPVPCDFGRGFQLEGFELEGGAKYAVCLDGEKTSCECKGFLKHGHCKHVEGLAALVKASRL
jgi:hypothetical protein